MGRHQRTTTSPSKQVILYKQKSASNPFPSDDMSLVHIIANRWWSVQVNVVDAPIFYIGWEWEAKIHERMCTFQVDGVPGWGISEFMYRNMGPGRPEEYNEKDPEWTRNINKG